MKRLIIRWSSLVLAILTAVMIYAFSADTGAESGQMSGEITEKVLNTVGITEQNTPPQEYAVIKENTHFSIRKLAHFSEYFLLGFFLCVFFCTFSMKRWAAALFALAISVLYATLDEWHQSFVPDRGPGVGDVLVDSAGALFGVLIVMLGAYVLMKRGRGMQKRTDKKD